MTVIFRVLFFGFFFLSAPCIFNFTILSTKTFLHPPGTYEIEETTMVVALTKKLKQKAEERGNCPIIEMTLEFKA